MKFTYLSFAFFCLLVGYTAAKSSKSKSDGEKSSTKSITCNEEALKKADLCGEKLFFVGKNARTFPTTEPDTEKYCTNTQNLVHCVKRYTDRCSRNELQKNLANVMLYTVRSHHKAVCGSRSKRGQMVTMSRCANSIRRKSTSCMDKMLVEFGQAMGLKESNNRVPYACCAFHKMRTCILRAAERAGREVCSEKATDIFEQYIASMAGNTLQLMCNDYDSESDRCEAVKRLSYDPKRAKTPESLLKAFGDLLLAEPTKP
ncbi:hypothetical protein TYRP_015176 [Tyrophagus putrescentiae]|nr:hypothetical protein TYRP_015176 [Tyrophagus putrescentiae]